MSLSIFCLALLGNTAESHAQVDPVQIELMAEDSVRTISFWYERTDDAPVIILLHNVGTSSSNFRPLIPVLFRAGFQVLAVDMRGHGRSRDLSPEIYDAMRSRQNSAFHSMKYDVEAAIQWLQDEQGIKPERISFVGGQFGSTLAIQALAGHPKLFAVIALSPSNNYYGQSMMGFMDDYGNRPLYLILPKQLQTRGANDVREVMRDNPQFKMKLFPRAEIHGVDLLGTSWRVEELIVKWLREIYQMESS
jgi:pimeloyl-ACP methyl ester carboxylesterase